MFVALLVFALSLRPRVAEWLVVRPLLIDQHSAKHTKAHTYTHVDAGLSNGNIRGTNYAYALPAADTFNKHINIIKLRAINAIYPTRVNRSITRRLESPELV